MPRFDGLFFHILNLRLWVSTLCSVGDKLLERNPDPIWKHLSMNKTSCKAGYQDVTIQDAVGAELSRQETGGQQMEWWPKPKGELDLVFPTEGGTPENAANLLYRRFFPALEEPGYLA